MELMLNSCLPRDKPKKVIVAISVPGSSGSLVDLHVLKLDGVYLALSVRESV